MFCRYCGQQIEDDSIFCNKCGAKLSNGQKPISTPDQYFVLNNDNQQSDYTPPTALSKIRFTKWVSLCIALITFIVPLQISKVCTITGFDLITFSEKIKFWGSFDIPSAFLAITLFAATIGIIVYTITPAAKNNYVIVIFTFALTIFVFIMGIVCIGICHESWKPWTLSFIPMILQTPIFIIYVIAAGKSKSR